MLTLTSEYALRAVVFLTQHQDEWPIPAVRIAAETGVPRKYLSKILGDLVRIRLLDGSRGKGGGFRTTRSPKKIHLVDVLVPFEPVNNSRRPCPFGNAVCSDQDPCGGHERWKLVREAYQRFLEETSVDDIAFRRRGVHVHAPLKRKRT